MDYDRLCKTTGTFNALMNINCGDSSTDKEISDNITSLNNKLDNLAHMLKEYQK